jgi:serine O-acetyltransferase
MNTDVEYNKFAQTLKERRDDHSLGFQLKKGTQEFIDNMLAVLFPHFCKEGFFTTEEIESRLILLERDLKRLLIPILKDTSLNLDEIAIRFMHALPNIHDKLWLDAEAITSGDPAAESIDEVILA